MRSGSASPTLRQLKDARTSFHNGSLTRVRDAVQYFNAGLPQDPVAGAAATLDARFTHPRGAGSARGLGLSERQVDELTECLENGLHDPAFVHCDPKSTTPPLQPHERELTCSKYRPDLAALDAKDGFVLSGLATDNDDPLSRRDLGLKFLDVTAQAHVVRIERERERGGDPCLRVFLEQGVILPGQSIAATRVFRREERGQPLGDSLVLLSGQGRP